MRYRYLILCLSLSVGVTACVSNRPKEATIASLKAKDYAFDKVASPPLEEPRVIEQYRQFLEMTPTEPMYSEAMRRLADLELENSERTTNRPRQEEPTAAEINSAIQLYQTYLKTYPNSKKNGMVLYQLARAYALQGNTEQAMAALTRITRDFPNFALIDEVQFRRGETLFVLRKYDQSARAYHSIIEHHPKSIYYEKSLYKYGWTQFKDRRYTNALNAFFKLLDRKYTQGQLLSAGPAPGLSRPNREILQDTLHAVSLSFSYLQGRESLATYFRHQGARNYEPLIYRQLGELYLSKDRIHDAAATDLAFVARFPNSPLAPQFHQAAIEAYKKGGFPSLVLPAKAKFVKLYGVQSHYWQQQTPAVKKQITPLLKKHLRDLATYYHAAARKDHKPATFSQAAQWYATYIKSFPGEPDTASMNFLLADCLFDGKRYAEATQQYEKTAYQYPPHARSAEAGYAAILAYIQAAKTLPPAQQASWQEKKISSALKFADTFPQHKQAPAVLTKTAEELFQLKQYPRAVNVADRVIHNKNVHDRSLEKTAWLVYAHSQYELAHYADAEHAYGAVLTYLPKKDKQRTAIHDRLAASIYKQAEQARQKGNLSLAVAHYLRVKQVVPTSHLVVKAEYDAATVLIQMKDWQQAAQVLQRFRRQYPKNKLQHGVTEKLALVYTKSGQSLMAAAEMENLALASNDRSYRQTMLWQAATLFKNGKQSDKAARLYRRYVREFPSQLPQSIEARHYLAEHYQAQHDAKRWGYWLNEIIKADRAAGTRRTDRTRTLAAEATLTLAHPRLTAYKKVALRIPLKKSLKRKKALMKKAIKAYERAASYQISDVSTAATYQIAEIYHDFARAISKSQRPRGLSADELEQYNLLLDEQSYPFEEKAIDIHAANLKHTTEGIYDEWVKKSQQQLIKLEPARYAKSERSDPYAEAIQ